MDDTAILEGAISIRAVLRSGSREISRIVIRDDKYDADTDKLERAAKSGEIKLERVSSDAIDAQASGKTHGGIIAYVGPRKFETLEALCTQSHTPWIVMIDGVEDPFNFGAAVRAIYAAGSDGLVLRPRNWMSAAGVVARSSAGASELIPTAIAETVVEAAETARQHGMLVACATDAGDCQSLYEADLRVPLFLLIGGEKRGITRSFVDNADLRLRIPYGRPEALSLGTASAASIMAFEIMRQRGQFVSRTNATPTSHAPSLKPRRRPSRGF